MSTALIVSHCCDKNEIWCALVDAGQWSPTSYMYRRVHTMLSSGSRLTYVHGGSVPEMMCLWSAAPDVCACCEARVAGLFSFFLLHLAKGLDACGQCKALLGTCEQLRYSHILSKQIEHDTKMDLLYTIICFTICNTALITVLLLFY